jgi:hypothetical protein
MTLSERASVDGYCPECGAEIDLAEYYPALASKYDTLAARCAELELERDAWISVEERLPQDDCEPVWCHGTYEGQYAPCGFEGVYRHRRWVCLNNGDYIDGGYGDDYEAQVTHWMPLPAAPAMAAQAEKGA